MYNLDGKKISNEGDCKIVNGGFFVINIVMVFYFVLFFYY